MSVWVVDTSPLVFLGHLGRLEFLLQDGREVCIPRRLPRAAKGLIPERN